MLVIKKLRRLGWGIALVVYFALFHYGSRRAELLVATRLICLGLSRHFLQIRANFTETEPFQEMLYLACKGFINLALCLNFMQGLL